MTSLYIYALREPSNAEIRYVGKTNCPTQRLHNHRFGNYRNRNSRLYDWVHSLNGKPLLTILSVCDENEWGIKEIGWISYLREVGADLLNISTGGAGPIVGRTHSPSLEAREKLRKAHAEQFADPKRREKHSEAVKAWFAALPEDKKEHIRNAGRVELNKHRDPVRQGRLAKARWAAMTPTEREEWISFRTQRIRETMTPEKKARMSVASVLKSSSTEWRERSRRNKKNDWARLSPKQYADRCERIRAGKATRKVRLTP